MLKRFIVFLLTVLSLVLGCSYFCFAADSTTKNYVRYNTFYHEFNDGISLDGILHYIDANTSAFSGNSSSNPVRIVINNTSGYERNLGGLTFKNSITFTNMHIKLEHNSSIGTTSPISFLDGTEYIFSTGSELIIDGIHAYTYGGTEGNVRVFNFENGGILRSSGIQSRLWFVMSDVYFRNHWNCISFVNGGKTDSSYPVEIGATVKSPDWGNTSIQNISLLYAGGSNTDVYIPSVNIVNSAGYAPMGNSSDRLPSMVYVQAWNRANIHIDNLSTDDYTDKHWGEHKNIYTLEGVEPKSHMWLANQGNWGTLEIDNLKMYRNHMGDNFVGSLDAAIVCYSGELKIHNVSGTVTNNGSYQQALISHTYNDHAYLPLQTNFTRPDGSKAPVTFYRNMTSGMYYNTHINFYTRGDILSQVKSDSINGWDLSKSQWHIVDYTSNVSGYDAYRLVSEPSTPASADVLKVALPYVIGATWIDFPTLRNSGATCSLEGHDYNIGYTYPSSQGTVAKWGNTNVLIFDFGNSNKCAAFSGLQEYEHWFTDQGSIRMTFLNQPTANTDPGNAVITNIGSVYVKNTRVSANSLVPLTFKGYSSVDNMCNIRTVNESDSFTLSVSDYSKSLVFTNNGNRPMKLRIDSNGYTHFALPVEVNTLNAYNSTYAVDLLGSGDINFEVFTIKGPPCTVTSGDYIDMIAVHNPCTANIMFTQFYARGNNYDRRNDKIRCLLAAYSECLVSVQIMNVDDYKFNTKNPDNIDDFLFMGINNPTFSLSHVYFYDCDFADTIDYDWNQDFFDTHSTFGIIDNSESTSNSNIGLIVFYNCINFPEVINIYSGNGPLYWRHGLQNPTSETIPRIGFCSKDTIHLRKDFNSFPEDTKWILNARGEHIKLTTGDTPTITWDDLDEGSDAYNHEGLRKFLMAYDYENTKMHPWGIKGEPNIYLNMDGYLKRSDDSSYLSNFGDWKVRNAAPGTQKNLTLIKSNVIYLNPYVVTYRPEIKVSAELTATIHYRELYTCASFQAIENKDITFESMSITYNAEIRPNTIPRDRALFEGTHLTTDSSKYTLISPYIHTQNNHTVVNVRYLDIYPMEDGRFPEFRGNNGDSTSDDIIIVGPNGIANITDTSFQDIAGNNFIHFNKSEGNLTNVVTSWATASKDIVVYDGQSDYGTNRGTIENLWTFINNKAHFVVQALPINYEDTEQDGSNPTYNSTPKPLTIKSMNIQNMDCSAVLWLAGRGSISNIKKDHNINYVRDMVFIDDKDSNMQWTLGKGVSIENTLLYGMRKNNSTNSYFIATDEFDYATASLNFTDLNYNNNHWWNDDLLSGKIYMVKFPNANKSDDIVSRTACRHETMFEKAYPHSYNSHLIYSNQEFVYGKVYNTTMDKDYDGVAASIRANSSSGTKHQLKTDVNESNRDSVIVIPAGNTIETFDGDRYTWKINDPLSLGGGSVDKYTTRTDSKKYTTIANIRIESDSIYEPREYAGFPAIWGSSPVKFVNVAFDGDDCDDDTNHDTFMFFNYKLDALDCTFHGDFDLPSSTYSRMIAFNTIVEGTSSTDNISHISNCTFSKVDVPITATKRNPSDITSQSLYVTGNTFNNSKIGTDMRSFNRVDITDNTFNNLKGTGILYHNINGGIVDKVYIEGNTINQGNFDSFVDIDDNITIKLLDVDNCTFNDSNMVHAIEVGNKSKFRYMIGNKYNNVKSTGALIHLIGTPVYDNNGYVTSTEIRDSDLLRVFEITSDTPNDVNIKGVKVYDSTIRSFLQKNTLIEDYPLRKVNIISPIFNNVNFTGYGIDVHDDSIQLIGGSSTDTSYSKAFIYSDNEITVSDFTELDGIRTREYLKSQGPITINNSTFTNLNYNSGTHRVIKSVTGKISIDGSEFNNCKSNTHFIDGNEISVSTSDFNKNEANTLLYSSIVNTDTASTFTRNKVSHALFRPTNKFDIGAYSKYNEGSYILGTAIENGNIQSGAKALRDTITNWPLVSVEVTGGNEYHFNLKAVEITGDNHLYKVTGKDSSGSHVVKIGGTWDYVTANKGNLFEGDVSVVLKDLKANHNATVGDGISLVQFNPTKSDKNQLSVTNSELCYNSPTGDILSLGSNVKAVVINDSNLHHNTGDNLLNAGVVINHPITYTNNKIHHNDMNTINMSVTVVRMTNNEFYNNKASNFIISNNGYWVNYNAESCTLLENNKFETNDARRLVYSRSPITAVNNYFDNNTSYDAILLYGLAGKIPSNYADLSKDLLSRAEVYTNVNGYKGSYQTSLYPNASNAYLTVVGNKFDRASSGSNISTSVGNEVNANGFYVIGNMFDEANGAVYIECTNNFAPAVVNNNFFQYSHGSSGLNFLVANKVDVSENVFKHNIGTSFSSHSYYNQDSITESRSALISIRSRGGNVSSNSSIGDSRIFLDYVPTNDDNQRATSYYSQSSEAKLSMDSNNIKDNTANYLIVVNGKGAVIEDNSSHYTNIKGTIDVGPYAKEVRFNDCTFENSDMSNNLLSSPNGRQSNTNLQKAHSESSNITFDDCNFNDISSSVALFNVTDSDDYTASNADASRGYKDREVTIQNSTFNNIDGNIIFNRNGYVILDEDLFDYLTIPDYLIYNDMGVIRSDECIIKDIDAIDADIIYTVSNVGGSHNPKQEAFYSDNGRGYVHFKELMCEDLEVQSFLKSFNSTVSFNDIYLSDSYFDSAPIFLNNSYLNSYSSKLGKNITGSSDTISAVNNSIVYSDGDKVYSNSDVAGPIGVIKNVNAGKLGAVLLDKSDIYLDDTDVESIWRISGNIYARDDFIYDPMTVYNKKTTENEGVVVQYVDMRNKSVPKSFSWIPEIISVWDITDCPTNDLGDRLWLCYDDSQAFYDVVGPHADELVKNKNHFDNANANVIAPYYAKQIPGIYVSSGNIKDSDSYNYPNIAYAMHFADINNHFTVKNSYVDKQLGDYVDVQIDDISDFYLDGNDYTVTLGDDYNNQERDFAQYIFINTKPRISNITFALSNVNPRPIHTIFTYDGSTGSMTDYNFDDVRFDGAYYDTKQSYLISSKNADAELNIRNLSIDSMGPANVHMDHTYKTARNISMNNKTNKGLINIGSGKMIDTSIQSCEENTIIYVNPSTKALTLDIDAYANYDSTLVYNNNTKTVPYLSMSNCYDTFGFVNNATTGLSGNYTGDIDRNNRSIAFLDNPSGANNSSTKIAGVYFYNNKDTVLLSTRKNAVIMTGDNTVYSNKFTNQPAVEQDIVSGYVSNSLQEKCDVSANVYKNFPLFSLKTGNKELSSNLIYNCDWTLNEGEAALCNVDGYVYLYNNEIYDNKVNRDLFTINSEKKSDPKVRLAQNNIEDNTATNSGVKTMDYSNMLKYVGTYLDIGTTSTIYQSPYPYGAELKDSSNPFFDLSRGGVNDIPIKNLNKGSITITGTPGQIYANANKKLESILIDEATPDVSTITDKSKYSYIESTRQSQPNQFTYVGYTKDADYIPNRVVLTGINNAADEALSLDEFYLDSPNYALKALDNKTLIIRDAVNVAFTTTESDVIDMPPTLRGTAKSLTLRIPEIYPTKQGKLFRYWKDIETGSIYVPGQFIVQTKDLTLEAVFAIKDNVDDYVVTYRSLLPVQNYTLPYSTSDHRLGEKYIIPDFPTPIPIDKDQTFISYEYYDITTGNVVTVQPGTDITIKGDIVLLAVYTEAAADKSIVNERDKTPPGEEENYGDQDGDNDPPDKEQEEPPANDIIENIIQPDHCIYNPRLDMYYNSILEAVEEAQDNDKLLVTHDIVNTDPIEISKNITISIDAFPLTDEEKLQGISPDRLIAHSSIKLSGGAKLICGNNLAFNGSIYIGKTSYLTPNRIMMTDVYIEPRLASDGPAIRNSTDTIGRFVTVHPYPKTQPSEYTNTKFVGFTDITLTDDGTGKYIYLSPISEAYWVLDDAFVHVPYDWKHYNVHHADVNGQDEHWIGITNYKVKIQYRVPNLSTSENEAYTIKEQTIETKMVGGVEYTLPTELPSDSNSYLDEEFAGTFTMVGTTTTRPSGQTIPFPESREEDVIWVANYKAPGTLNILFENASVKEVDKDGKVLVEEDKATRPSKSYPGGKSLKWVTAKEQATFATISGGYPKDSVIRTTSDKFMNKYMTTTPNGYLFSHFEVYDKQGNQVQVNGKTLIWDPYYWNEKTGVWEEDPNPDVPSVTYSGTYSKSLSIDTDYVFKAFYVEDFNNDNIPDSLQDTAKFYITSTRIKNNVDGGTKLVGSTFDKASIKQWAIAMGYIYDDSKEPIEYEKDMWYCIEVLVNPNTGNAMIQVPQIQFNVPAGAEAPKYTNWVLYGTETAVYPFDANITVKAGTSIYLYPYNKANIYTVSFAGDFSYLTNPPSSREIAEGTPLNYLELTKLDLAAEKAAPFEVKGDKTVVRDASGKPKWKITTSVPITINGTTKSTWSRDELISSGFFNMNNAFIGDRNTANQAPLINSVSSNIKVTLKFEIELEKKYDSDENYKAGLK